MALVVPSAVTLFSQDKKPILVMTLNEEEQKSGEKELKKFFSVSEYLWRITENPRKPDFEVTNTLDYSGFIKEIIPPPPKA